MKLSKHSQIAISGVPGPVHIAIPIDVQHAEVGSTMKYRCSPERKPIIPELETIQTVAKNLLQREDGCILVGQGVRGSVDSLIELAEMLNWPILTTPQAKGYIPEDHPLLSRRFWLRWP